MRIYFSVKRVGTYNQKIEIGGKNIQPNSKLRLLAMAVTTPCFYCIKDSVHFSLYLFVFLLSGPCDAKIRYSISEELENGSVVGDVARDLGLDLEKLSTRRFRMLENGRRFFTLNHLTGKLMVSGRIDRETVCAFSGTCSLTLDVVLENPLEVHKLTVDVVDINDNSPLFSKDEYELEVLESALTGSRFHIEEAQDADDGSNSVKLYRLNPSDHISLDPVKIFPANKHIELILKKPFDREQTPSHQLILTAIDGGTPERTGTAKINVRVLDANDNAPVFENSVYKVKLYENPPKDTLVLKLNATDADEGSNGEVFYSFSGYTPERVRQIFSLNIETGEIRVKNSIDYEETKSYEIYIQAMDKGPAPVAGHCKVVVEVLDVNDNIPELVLSSLSSPVREDARTDTVVALISVVDRDSGLNKKVNLEIFPDLPFKIKSFRNHYTVVTSAFLDREAISSYNVTVSAVDGGNPPLSSQLTFQVDVADINDNPPKFEQTSYTVYVTENNAPGAYLCIVKATDVDAGENARVTYTVLTANNYGIPIASYVSIKPDTGEAYALRAFDFEKLQEFHFQIKAQDNGVPPLNRVATVYVYIMDQNDHAPKIVYPPNNGSHITLLKNSEAEVLVTKVMAWDSDAGKNAWLLYGFVHTDFDLFKIHEYTGEIQTTRRVTEENSTSFVLSVLVCDNGVPPLSSAITLHVHVMEQPPKLTPDPKRIIRPNSPLMFSTVTIYLIIALCATTFVFLVTVFVLAIVRCHAYCTQPGSCCPCCISKKYIPDGGASADGGRAAGGRAGPQQTNNVFLRRDLKVEPHYIEVRRNGSLTETYCYKTCLTATSGSDTFMFYNTGRPHSGTWGSGYVTSHSGQSQIIVRRLSMPDAATIASFQPKAPNSDWRYSASLRAGGVMQSSVHMEESSVLQGAQGVLVQNWPTASSAADAEGGEVSPPMGAGVDSNSWHFRYGPGGPGAPHLKPGEVPPEAFIIPGSPAIISIRQNQGGDDDKSDFITFGKKEEAKKKKKKKKEKKDKKDKGKDDGDE